MRIYVMPLQEGFTKYYQGQRVPYIVRSSRDMRHITQGVLISALMKSDKNQKFKA